MIDRILIGVVTFVVAFVLGAGLMLDSWKDAAKRGSFEVGHKLYRVTPIE